MTIIEGKLLVFELTIQSSYIENYEAIGDKANFDTLQWWFTKDETWRIKTFAKDSDIHIHRIADRVEIETAIQNTRKHYGDVLEKTFLLEFENIDNRESLQNLMKEFGGINSLEISENEKFVFWNPTQTKFSSKSQPE